MHMRMINTPRLSARPYIKVKLEIILSSLPNIPRNDGFDITVASEIMAIFCLASNLQDLEEKIAPIYQ